MSWKFSPFILLALIETASCGTAQAAPTTASEPAATATPESDDLDQLMRRLMTKLDAELHLSETQETQVQKILEHHVEQMRPHIEYIRKQPSRPARRRAAMERKEALRKIRTETIDAMKGVLTEDQFERFLELREEFRRKMADRMRG